MGLPAIIYIIINNYMPLYGLQIAFKNYRVIDGISGSEWCGLNNFKYLFASDAFRITRNTVLYQFSWLILNTILSVFLAIFLNEIVSKKAKKFYQSMVLLPYLISYVIVAYIVYVFLSDTGIFNTILNALGAEPVSWYMEKKYWPFILTFVNSWKSIGFTTIIYLSTIVGFGTDYYEAAELDGATPMSIFARIVLPLSKPALASIGLFIAVGMWNNYMNFILYITDADKKNFQVKVRELILSDGLSGTNIGISEDMLKNAMVIIVVMPFLIIYPFLQKYFVKGVTVGAVKG